MQTLDLVNAAIFLKMNPEVLRRKAKAGGVPSRKTGKSWVFVQEHLADWISGRYQSDTQQTASIQCQSTNAKIFTGYSSQTQTANEYNALLGLKTK
jgi:hypothetical protein